jgi:hypothetical protein
VDGIAGSRGGSEAILLEADSSRRELVTGPEPRADSDRADAARRGTRGMMVRSIERLVWDEKVKLFPR